MAREIEIVGFDDVNGYPVGGYAIESHKRRQAWTPRQIKKLLARDGATRFVKRVVHSPTQSLTADRFDRMTRQDDE